MQNKLLLFITILVLSCVNNLIIPYLIYIKTFGLFKKRPQGFIGVNTWGIIMDGVLAGLINIVTLNYLLDVKPLINFDNLMPAFILGLSSMGFCHIYMAVRKWKIWIMPKPWNWNMAGYWHMISMTLQMSYIAYFFVILIKHPAETVTQSTILLVLLLSLLFLLALRLHIKGVKIGKIHISNKPW